MSVLQHFGDHPSDAESERTLEAFLCHVYDKSCIVDSVGELRWELYRTKALEGENLPPTKGALTQHIRRAWLAALIGKSYTSPCPDVPRPEDHGWYRDDSHKLKPVTSLILPVPESILELVKCVCKGKCVNKQCSCKKNDLPCSPMCKYKDVCENKPPRTDEYDPISSDEEEF